MPRVTQDPDFTIHEDETSQSMPMKDGAPSPNPEVTSTESSFVEETGDNEGTHNEEEPNNPEVVNTPAENNLADQVEEQEASEISDEATPHTEEGDESLVSQEEEDDETPAATELLEGEDESIHDPESRRESSGTDRRTSGRTEALIKEAARSVVERLERNRSQSQSDLHPSIEEDDRDDDGSFVSHTTEGTHGVDGTELSYLSHSEASPRQSDAYTHSEASPRLSDATQSEASTPQSDAHLQADDSPRVSDGHMLPAPVDEAGGDSSSHHEAEDDVFSDRSPRSSMGSLSSDPDRKQGSLDETLTQATKSPRISGISQYDKEDFVPTVRGTPRVPFRTPSDVRAMQMSSPPPSVYGSPRSSKRPPLPTISRLGSPSGTVQYSPKRRSTPPRFKSRKEPAPLVLLHVTLLPLRWFWAGVMEAAETHQLSESAKTLRDNWRQLQDRMGDTVVERGILLPHPQNDFEVLEERLLEALDLPLRRRARILECGHYLGPANETTISDDVDSGDEDYDAESRRNSMEKKTHWCTTCRHEIKYDSLGPGKVFRIKVYASNGLMKAGAWEACWKEMERVDIELEPIVESSLSEELGRLAAEQQAREEEEQRMAEQQLGEHHGEHESHRVIEKRCLPSSRMVEQQQQQQQQGHHGHHANQVVEERRLHPSRMVEQHPMSQQEDDGAHTRNHEHEHEHDYEESLLSNRRIPQVLTSSPANHMGMESPRMTSPRMESPRVESTRGMASPRMESPRFEGMDTERRRRDEERLREIYGHTPPPPHAQHSPRTSSSMHPHPDSYIPPPSPPSPSAQAYERRQSRRTPYQTASLPELLLEALKVVLQDRKNLVIAILSFLAMLLAVRGGNREEPHNHFPATARQDIPTIATQEPLVETVEQAVVSSVATTSSVTVETSVASEAPTVPCVQLPPQGQEPDVKQPEVKEPKAKQPEVKEPEPKSDTQPAEPFAASVEKKTNIEVETVTTKEVVRVVETITETVKVTATATEVEQATASSELEQVVQATSEVEQVSSSSDVQSETVVEPVTEETPSVEPVVADKVHVGTEHNVEDDASPEVEQGAKEEVKEHVHETERDEL